MSRRSLVLLVAGLGLLGLGIWYFSGPYRLTHHLQRAIESQDKLAILNAMDESRIRAAITDRLVREAARAQASGKPHPILVMGPSMSALMAQREAWALTDPDGFVRAIGAGQTGGGLSQATVRPAGLTRFTITPQAQGAAMLVVAWEGTSWKVVDLVYSNP